MTFPRRPHSAGETDPEVGRATCGRGAPSGAERRRAQPHLRPLSATPHGGSRPLRGLRGAAWSRTDAKGIERSLRAARPDLRRHGGCSADQLIPANLNPFFLFGAYGSDARNRAKLTAVAINKADRLHTNLKPSQVALVGVTGVTV
jgi:hypothetical protein